MGYVGDRPEVNTLHFYVAMTAIAGIATLLVPAITSFISLAVYCSMFGFFISANYALTTIILVSLLGIDRLTNAFGLVSMAGGIAILVGPPLAGMYHLPITAQWSPAINCSYHSVVCCNVSIQGCLIMM